MLRIFWDDGSWGLRIFWDDDSWVRAFLGMINRVNYLFASFLDV